VVSTSSFGLGELVLGGTSSSLSTGLVVFVQLHEFGEIKLRLLEKLDLPDHAVVFKREDLGALLLDLFTNVVLNKKFDEVFEGVALDFLLHNLHHLFADELLVRSLGIAGSLNLFLVLLSKSNAEHSENVAILGLSLNESFDEGVPFLDHSSTMVPGDVHAIEVGIAVKAFDFLNLEPKLLPSSGLGRGVAVTET
jgi:hypothetical protein